MTTSLQAQTSWYPYTHMWVYSWAWALGPLMMLFLFILLAFVIWNFVKSGPRRVDSMAQAKQLLAERYAKGELSTEEYRERLATLEGH